MKNNDILRLYNDGHSINFISSALQTKSKDIKSKRQAILYVMNIIYKSQLKTS